MITNYFWWRLKMMDMRKYSFKYLQKSYIIFVQQRVISWFWNVEHSYLAYRKQNSKYGKAMKRLQKLIFPHLTYLWECGPIIMIALVLSEQIELIGLVEVMLVYVNSQGETLMPQYLMTRLCGCRQPLVHLLWRLPSSKRVCSPTKSQ